MIVCSGPSLLSPTGLTQSAFALTQGRVLRSALNDYFPIKLGSTRGPRHRGVTLQFFGQGADDASFNWKIWGARGTMLQDSNGPSNQGLDMGLRLLMNGTGQLSTMTGVSTGLITTADRMADTIVPTKSAYLTHLETVFDQEVVTYSPADNTPAEIVMVDTFNFSDLVIEVERGAITKLNALVEKYT
jgi:hypothetical protein